MPRETNVELHSLIRLKDLVALSDVQFRELTDNISVREVERHRPICGAEDTRHHVYLLLSGAVACTCPDPRRGRRKLLTLIPPGLIPALPQAHPPIEVNLRYEAYTNCKIGRADMQSFMRIMLSNGIAGHWQFLNLQLRNWFSMLLRFSRTSLGGKIRDRLALALLELGSQFGIQDARGTLLAVCPSHEDLADLVGTTRSKITHALGEFERRGMIVRIGRRIVVRQDRLEPCLSEAAGLPHDHAPSHDSGAVE
jgi:CRP/FNR family transcriptional regulator, cyclic AMP receptor protein